VAIRALASIAMKINSVFPVASFGASVSLHFNFSTNVQLLSFTATSAPNLTFSDLTSSQEKQKF
jgi:hypothetical protein